jgi:hypothetical protein
VTLPPLQPLLLLVPLPLLLLLPPLLLLLLPGLRTRAG